MSKTICGVDCSNCPLQDECAGCIETKGHPFHGNCLVAMCCLSKGNETCERCDSGPCMLKEQIIMEFNNLGIKDMPEVKNLNSLKGSFINLEYPLPNGQTVKLWEDDKIYLGNQLCTPDCDICYGLIADETHLLVCQYGEGGSNPQILVYKRREH